MSRRSMASALVWTWIVDEDDPAEKQIAEALDAVPADRVADFMRTLAERAQSGGPEAVDHYALALAFSGEAHRAVPLWERLVRSGRLRPLARLNLAGAYVALQRVESAAATLRDCEQDPGVEAAVRFEAGRRLAELDAARERMAQERRMFELRIAALRERLALGVAGPGDLLDLARLLGAMMSVPDADVDADQVLAAARDAHDAAPQDAGPLELLAGLLIARGETAELVSVLLKLEEVAPHSVVLEEARRVFRGDPDYEAEVSEYLQRTMDLVVRTGSGDQDAEAVIRERLRRFPANLEYRVALMMGARARLEWPEALRMADELAAGYDGTHFVHFHVSQVYWHAGRRDTARRHFVRAVQTAAGDRDREDVYEMMRILGASHG